MTTPSPIPTAARVEARIEELKAEVGRLEAIIAAAGGAEWQQHPLAQGQNIAAAILGLAAAARQAPMDERGNAFALEHITHALTKVTKTESALALSIAEVERLREALQLKEGE